MVNKLYDIDVKTNKGTIQKLSDYKGKVLLIVNTASQCGFTPQYKGLEELYKRYEAKGFCVLGFPCNQFGGQEPASDQEIASFCEINFGVTFPLFSKVEVNGPKTHPLFEMLKAEAPGLLGSQAIKWNFTKFLVDRSSQITTRFAPNTKPDSMAGAIESLL